MQDIAPALSGLPQSATLMARDGFEARDTSTSHTRLDDTPGDPVLLVGDVSAADFNLSRGQEDNDLSMGDPNSITVDAMEAAFPNESILIDESWDYPQFLDGFDWQLPTLVSFIYVTTCSIALIASLGGGELARRFRWFLPGERELVPKPIIRRDRQHLSNGRGDHNDERLFSTPLKGPQSN